jgi:cytoskeleton protein RodZ
MSRRKRGRAQPPQAKPMHKGDAPESRMDDPLRLKHGGAELSSALRLEIGVDPAPVALAAPDDIQYPPEELDLFAAPPEANASDEAHAAAIPEAEAGAGSQVDAVAFAVEAAASEPAPRVDPAPAARALGLRFADARTVLGLSREDAARRLRVPFSVVADIEAERYDALGPPIYARGYLRSYARLVQLPEAAVASVLAGLVEQPEQPLQPALSAQPRPLAPRFATPALYALLTLLLVVPVAVQLYQRSRLPDTRSSVDTAAAQREVPLESRTAATIDPLATSLAAGTSDSSPAGDGSAPPDAAGPSGQDAASERADVDPRPAPPQAHSAEPVLASLAPMPARAPAATGQHVLLKLAESSWVELIGADGSRIEYAMLPAGTAREYQVAGKASLRIGNTRGASLSVDGKELDLAAFSRGNVARVNLGDVEPAPSGNP